MYKKKILFLILLILSIYGCSKDDGYNPIIGNNLFPLTQGNRLEYNMYDLDSSFTKIEGTDRKFIREIGSSKYIIDRIGYPMLETYYNISGSIERIDTTYVYKSASDDTISYYMKFIFPLSNNNKLIFYKWAPVFIRGAGTLSYYTIIDTTITVSTSLSNTEYPVPLNIKIQNYIFDQDKISVPENTAGYKCNKIEMYYSLSIAGVTLRSGTYYQIWFAEGVGPIKERKTYTEKENGTNIELSAKSIK